VAKALSWAIVGAALLLGTYQIGRQIERVTYEKTYAKALSVCDRPGYGTAFVSYRFDTWHCFYRHSEYPYRVKYATIVLNEDRE
jgi:hypothetical protein